jgi:hypothetical protein
MRKIIKAVAALMVAVAGITVISCEKEEPLKGIVTYSVGSPNDLTSQVDGTIRFSDVFVVSVTYKDAAGNPVTVTDVQLPWELVTEVEAPFTASIDVDITLRQLANPPYEFPRPNGKLASIKIVSGGKQLIEGSLQGTGTGSGLYSNVNNWLTENGHISYSLVFTAETLDRNGSDI